jgi:hypothetical protein
LNISTEEDKEPDLPSSHPFQQLFNNRITFIAGDPEDGGVSPTLWFSTPPPEDIEPETDMVRDRLTAYRFILPALRLSVRPSLRLSVCLSVFLLVCLFVCVVVGFY